MFIHYYINDKHNVTKLITCVLSESKKPERRFFAYYYTDRYNKIKTVKCENEDTVIAVPEGTAEFILNIDNKDKEHSFDTLLLPESLQSIYVSNSSRLFPPIFKRIEISENNQFFSSKDGLLYNKEKTKLILCPSGICEAPAFPETLESIGSYAFADCCFLEKIVVPDTVRYIQQGCFCGCGALRSISLPNGIKTIENKTFSNCTALEEIILPDTAASIGSECFSGCTALKNIVLPAELLSIEASAFENCSSLESITLPDSVKKIGKDCFWGCSSLHSKTIALPKAREQLRKSDFEGCNFFEEIIIPDNVSVIGKNCFEGFIWLKKIKLPKDLIIIENAAFRDCTALEEIILPDGVMSIGSECFSGCAELKKAEFNEELEDIGDAAFSDCCNIESLIFPESLKNIGENAFYDCFSIENITFNGSVKNIAGSAFIGCTGVFRTDLPDGCQNPVIKNNILYNDKKQALLSLNSSFFEFDPEATDIPDSLFRGHRELTAITLPKHIKRIGQKAFQGCINLRTVTFECELEKIGSEAFKDCTSLKKMIMPDTVTAVGNEAFSGCISLKKLHMSSRLKKLGRQTFKNCIELDHAVIPENVVSLNAEVFSGCKKLTGIFLPDGIKHITDSAFKDDTSLRCIETSSLTIRSFSGFDIYNGEDIVKSIQMISDLNFAKRIDRRLKNTVAMALYINKNSKDAEIYLADYFSKDDPYYYFDPNVESDPDYGDDGWGYYSDEEYFYDFYSHKYNELTQEYYPPNKSGLSYNKWLYSYNYYIYPVYEYDYDDLFIETILIYGTEGLDKLLDSEEIQLYEYLFDPSSGQIKIDCIINKAIEAENTDLYTILIDLKNQLGIYTDNDGELEL